MKDIDARIQTTMILINHGFDPIQAAQVTNYVFDISRKVIDTMVNELEPIKERRLLISIMTAELCIDKMNSAIKATYKIMKEKGMAR